MNYFNNACQIRIELWGNFGQWQARDLYDLQRNPTCISDIYTKNPDFLTYKDIHTIWET